MISRFLLPVIPILALASCSTSGDGGSTPAATNTSRIRTADDWVADKTKDNGFKQDASGNLVPRSDRRSSFETRRQSAYFKGDYQKQEFKTAGSGYDTKPWWGKTEHARKTYTGDTDGSRFQQSSNLQGQTSREAGASARIPDGYNTGAYATGDARETGAIRLDHISDAETDSRRRVFVPPAVIDWRAQRQMTMDQSRGILGR